MLIKITFLLFFNRLQYVKHVNKALINSTNVKNQNLLKKVIPLFTSNNNN